VAIATWLACTACEDLKPIGSREERANVAPLEARGHVRAIVLSDRRCRQCNTEALVQSLRQRYFPDLQVTTLDYADAGGRRLYQELGLKLLPAMLFEPGSKRARTTPGSHAGRRSAAGTGSFRYVPTSTRRPRSVTTTRTIPATGRSTALTRPVRASWSAATRSHASWIYSSCRSAPTGVKALEAIKEILPLFRGRIDFDLHYIATSTADGIRSLHGQLEVDENIRQLCARKHYGADHKYMDYIWCRGGNYRSSDWRQCARDRIAAEVIERCARDEGKQLLEQDIKIAAALGVSGSPTWLANNRFQFGGIAAESVKNSFCQHNPGLPAATPG